MGNLGLTTIATGTASKRATIDANNVIVDNAQSETYTADMTSGNVALTDTQFREAVEIVGDNVTTTGRTLTIPNLQGVFLIRGDSNNTESFDLVKGATSVAIAPGEIAWYISGVGANDLERGGVLGLASGTVSVPRQRLRVGFNGPGTSTTAGIWNTSTDEISGAMAAMPETFVDDAGLDLSLSTNGLFEIPAGSGISRLKFSSTVMQRRPNQESAGFGIRQFRGYNGGTSEADLVFRERFVLTSATAHVFDRMGTFDGQGAPFECVEGDRIGFQYQQQGGNTINVFPVQERGACLHEVEIIDAAPAGTKPEPIVSSYHSGTPSANAVISKQVITRPILLGDDFAGSDAFVGTNPSGATVFDIHCNGEKFGQVSFSTSGVPTFSYIADAGITITNPGFETGDLTGWSSLHGSGGIASSANARSGSWHYRCSGLLNQNGRSQAVTTFPSGWNNLIDAGIVTGKYTFWQWVNSSGYFYTHGVQYRDTNARALGRTKWNGNPTFAQNSTYEEKIWTTPILPGTRQVDLLFECIRIGNGTGDLDDIAFDFTLSDVILTPGNVIEIVAPATLNGIADVAITLKGRLV